MGAEAGGAAIFLGGDFLPGREGGAAWGGRDFGAGFRLFNCGAVFFELFNDLTGYLNAGFKAFLPSRGGAADGRVGFLRWAMMVASGWNGDSGGIA